ncbi:hypothetical protein GH5_04742 [Leishmania sp. Ghana 2012 LV757]|uniref:hypothetical protein n=1 Tax=Leishmania sp. Ghana 2012 LV757 TaxID=2803181 RepID=UPI001B4D0BE2|nr:hypothetical protein GH5_04742 [Leishmania sp. Ghana 2012 LV757]
MQRATRPQGAPSVGARRAEKGPVLPSLRKDFASARKSPEAAARSAWLTNFFERLSSESVTARQSARPDEDFTEGFTDEVVEGLPSPTLRSRRQPLPTSAPFHHAANGAGSSSTGGVILRNDGAVVLSASCRGLPDVFREQAQTVRSMEMTAAEMQHTLQQLHQYLTLHARRRIEEERDAGGHSVSAARRRPSADWTSIAPLTGEAAALQQHAVADSDSLSEAVRIRRARAAAADEGDSDDQSVEDYAVDYKLPPLTSDSRLADEVAAIVACMAKMNESVKVMCDTEAALPSASTAPWWSSALRMRDMKASAARLGYHARTALSWSHRSLEQLLLQAVILNNASVDTRTQLLQQQQHRQEFQARLRHGQQTVTELQSDIAHCQGRLQAELARRAALQEELCLRARERGLLDPDDHNPLKAELALLLAEREWPSPALKRDARIVLNSLRSISMALE